MVRHVYILFLRKDSILKSEIHMAITVEGIHQGGYKELNKLCTWGNIYTDLKKNLVYITV
jgi:hypothetical protein